MLDSTRVTYLTEKSRQEKGAAHADPAMNLPVRDIHAKVVECFAPGQDVLVGPVHQRATSKSIAG
jgi:hypothetical protein